MSQANTTNSPPPSSASGAEANRVKIFDTTLRDGEQSPGASMVIAEKIEIARRSRRWAWM